MTCLTRSEGRPDVLYSFLRERPGGLHYLPCSLLWGSARHVNAKHDEALSLINTDCHRPLAESVPELARTLVDDSLEYKREWDDDARLVPTLSLWWTIPSHTFPGFPDAKYAVMMYLYCHPRCGGTSLAYAITRLVDSACFQYGPENALRVLGFAYIISTQGSYVFLLLDDRGWQALENDTILTGPSFEWEGYTVLARPPEFAQNFDGEWLTGLVEIRRFLVDRRALHPVLTTYLTTRTEPRPVPDAEKVPGVNE